MKILGVETGRDARQDSGELGRLLNRNAELREVFANAPELQGRLEDLQRWQSERLLRSHADLHRSPRYRKAVEFFFEELYSGGDARARDRDLLKVQRVMEKLLPAQALRSLTRAIELEVLSQELDAEVARALPAGPISVESYAEAYRKAGRRADRERQIDLLGEIGSYLDGVVRKPVIRGLVRLARGPAHAAGFGELQEFLEHGLNAFEAMGGSREFLDAIQAREKRAMKRVFAAAPDPFEFDDPARRAMA